MKCKVRPPAVAGMFYPDNAEDLRASIRGFLESAKPHACVPKALIAPHAGYEYSGPIAGSAYDLLSPLRDTIKQVVLVGPSHRAAFRGIAVSSADFFETPLGRVSVDSELAESALTCRQVLTFDPAHDLEHGIEVHLPFLQEILSSFSLLPLVVGDAQPDEVQAVIDRTWGGQETLIVISSDLSHYLDYASAQRMDAATTRAIENFRPDDIAPEQACGRLPIQGLLLAAKARGMIATTLDLRNSGDTAGPRDKVVGYGAYAFV